MPEDNLNFNIDEVIIGKDRRFTFKVSYVDGFGTKLEGEFISHIPSVNDIITIGVVESNMYAGATDKAAVPVEIQNVAFMKATLKVCLVNWPSWFKIDDIEDISLLELLFMQHKLVTDNFRSKSSVALA